MDRLAKFVFLFLHAHSHTREFTAQERAHITEGLASSTPCADPETLQGGEASVPTPVRSANDSPNTLKVPPSTATTTAPASDQSSPRLRPSTGDESGLADAAEAVVDDVFSTLGEVLSAQDSTRKEFHCALLRALSKEPAAAEADQAPGTPDESGVLPFHPPPLLGLHPSHYTPLLWEMWGVPACCVLSFFLWGGGGSEPYCLPHASILPSQSSALRAFCLHIFFPPAPFSLMSCRKASESWQIRLPFCSLIGRGAEQRGM